MTLFLNNTGSTIDRGVDDPTKEPRTSTGLSTQIIIKVNHIAVGALQELSTRQARPLERIKEIGTDGVIEIVPNNATTFELTARRIVFDQLRLPEAFSRAFRFINSQRVPFDIEIFDINNSSPETDVTSEGVGIVVMKYVNCWFTSYDTPYTADNYLITETATIWAETGAMSSPNITSGQFRVGSSRSTNPQSDTISIEAAVNRGEARGSLGAGGIVNALFDNA